MKCEHCGHDQASGSFCDACGRKMTRVIVKADEDDGSSTRCPQCARLSKTRICPNCGIPIPGWPTEEET